MNRYLPGYSRFRLYQPSLHQVVRPLSRPVSTDSAANAKRSPDNDENAVKTGERPESKKPKKTMAQLDEELRLKLEGRSGDGGAAGLELENGKAVAMKRGVRENMFRLI